MLLPVRRVVYFYQHDYLDLLYGALAPPAVAARATPSMLDASADACAIAGDAEIVHVNWPEHIIAFRDGEIEYDDSPEGWDARLQASLRFLERLTELDVKIVWTISNRRPHFWWKRRGVALYEAWARAAHAVVHLSRWGMELIRNELPFRKGAVHAVVSLGHFGDLMPPNGSRLELEKKLALPPCGLRVGVTGRPQRTRGAPFIMEAFAESRRADVQLLVTAVAPDDPRPSDPRIIAVPCLRARTRAEISDFVHVCDALMLAIDTPTYMSSATHADAFGVGIPMIVNRWPYFVEVLGDAALYFDGSRASLTQLFDSLDSDELLRARAAVRPLRERYTWTAAAAQYRALFDRL
jgi:hypothetical protein